jgi:hypothetical protein
MIVVFLSGPYSAVDTVVKRRNILQARQAAREVWEAGMAALCPHTNSGDFDGVAPEEVFRDGYLELVHRSDVVLALPGWERSRGAVGEIAEATAHGIPVFSSVAAIIVDATLSPRIPRDGGLRTGSIPHGSVDASFDPRAADPD